MYGLFCENYNKTYAILREETSHDFRRFFALSYTIQDVVFDRAAYDRLAHAIKRKTTRFSALQSRYTPLLISQLQLYSDRPEQLVEQVIEAEKHIKRRFIKDKAVRPFFALGELLNRQRGTDALPVVEHFRAERPGLNVTKQYVVTAALMDQKQLLPSFIEDVKTSEEWLSRWMGPSSERLIAAQILAASNNQAEQKQRIENWVDMLEKREVRMFERLFPLLALLHSTDRVDLIYVTRVVDRERSRNRFSEEVNWLLAFHLLLAKAGHSRLQSTLLVLETLELTKKR